MHQVYIVDVFASNLLSGNPLAVIVGDAYPSVQRMQRIAAEMNFSETSFVSLADSNDKYSVRVFTPVREIEFTGHPLIGTAAVIREFFAGKDSDVIELETVVGPIRVEFAQDVHGVETAWMRCPSMQLGATMHHEMICNSLGLSVLDLDSSLPIQVVTAGTAALMVPIRTATALFQAKPNFHQPVSLADKGCPKLIYLFCRETRQAASDFQVRFFFEANGVREDPATGNGAAFFGAYLLEHQPELASGFDYRLEQGHALGRPSLIRISGNRSAGRVQVWVGGAVFPVLRGEMLDA